MSCCFSGLLLNRFIHGCSLLLALTEAVPGAGLASRRPIFFKLICDPCLFSAVWPLLGLRLRNSRGFLIWNLPFSLDCLMRTKLNFLCCFDLGFDPESPAFEGERYLRLALAAVHSSGLDLQALSVSGVIWSKARLREVCVCLCKTFASLSKHCCCTVTDVVFGFAFKGFGGKCFCPAAPAPYLLSSGLP